MPASTFVPAALLCSVFAAGAWAQAAPAASDLAARGAYVARLGDCIACHTAPRGKPLAGGLALKTPFGTLYSTNITPDTATGIGRYSFEQFDRAMRQGVAADGHNLYPAMPYPSYVKISGDDMRALYAYLTQGVTPVAQANRPSEMSWPFTMRWGLSLWNRAFLEQAWFTPDTGHDAVWNRGAYLAQGLGHCGSCHTPRGIGFQEKAMADAGAAGRRYLAGETVDAWRAPSLRHLWTVEDTVTMLKTGQNRFGTVSGSMVEVILETAAHVRDAGLPLHHSTQHFGEADLVALATYLKSLPPGEDEVPMPALPARPAPDVPAALFTTEGGLAYAQFCADCHRQDGRGVKDVFPAPMRRGPAASSRSRAQADAAMVYPPLWGDRSFNIGAGMARTYTAAAFVKRNMPVGFQEKFPLGQGGLSDQEAVDVAAYFSHQPRPDFAAKAKDWPKDPKPVDARY